MQWKLTYDNRLGKFPNPLILAAELWFKNIFEISLSSNAITESQRDFLRDFFLIKDSHSSCFLGDHSFGYSRRLIMDSILKGQAWI